MLPICVIQFEIQTRMNLMASSFFVSSVGYIEISNLNVTFGRKVRDHQWVDLVKHYWAILLVVLVAALIIALMPIIG